MFNQLPPQPRLAVIGAGHVGLTLTFGYSDYGYHVSCLDNNAERINMLKAGKCPIHEPYFDEYAADTNEERAANDAGTILFTTDPAEALKASNIVFVSVGTPPTTSGPLDCTTVAKVIEDNGDLLAGKLVVIKSTMQPGATRMIQDSNPHIRLVYNPEFLSEGNALHDFRNPDRVVIGTPDGGKAPELEELHDLDRIIYTTYESAEVGKLASNAMLAARVSFMNEIAKVSDKCGADIKSIQEIMGADQRIGHMYLNAGLGWGGSCLPKDVNALISIVNDNTRSYLDATPMMHGMVRSNESQSSVAINKLIVELNGHLSGKNVAVFGLSFKPNTDDIRCSPALILIEKLLSHGVKVRAYDPVVKALPDFNHPFLSALSIEETAIAAATGADAIVIATEWEEFKAFDPLLLALVMKERIIVDARNCMIPQIYSSRGFKYVGIGR